MSPGAGAARRGGMRPLISSLSCPILLLAALFSGMSEAKDATADDLPFAVIWLMQGKEEMDLSFLRSPTSDAIQVVWGAKPSNRWKDAFYLPNSTVTEGRNFLLQHALRKEERRDQSYTYMIYTEDDAELEEINDFGESTGDPYRTFERYLDKYRPAVAFPFNGYGMPTTSAGVPEDVVPVCWWDHLMVAIHRNAVPALLPYWTGMDNESWWLAQRIVTVLSSAFFHNSRVQINALAVMNTQHRRNPEINDVDFGRADGWLMPAIAHSDINLQHAMCSFDNEGAVPPGYAEPFVNEGYGEPTPGRDKYLDDCHPLKRSMRAWWDSMPSRDRRLARTHDLVKNARRDGCHLVDLLENRVAELKEEGTFNASLDELAVHKQASQKIIQRALEARPEQLVVRSPTTTTVSVIGNSLDVTVKISGARKGNYRLIVLQIDRPDFVLLEFEKSVVEDTAPPAGPEFVVTVYPQLSDEFPGDVVKNGDLVEKHLKLELYRQDGTKASVSRIRIIMYVPQYTVVVD